MTIWAPNFIGCCKYGVAKQLSITRIKLCFLAIFPKSSKSIISIAGFVGDSANKIFVFGVIKLSIVSGLFISK